MNLDGEVKHPVACFNCGKIIEYEDGDMFVVGLDSEKAMIVVTCIKCHLDQVFEAMDKVEQEE
jgi:RNase P subunit RPR2